jgi:hypothetical protein
MGLDVDLLQALSRAQPRVTFDTVITLQERPRSSSTARDTIDSRVASGVSFLSDSTRTKSQDGPSIHQVIASTGNFARDSTLSWIECHESSGQNTFKGRPSVGNQTLRDSSVRSSYTIILCSHERSSLCLGFQERPYFIVIEKSKELPLGFNVTQWTFLHEPLTHGPRDLSKETKILLKLCQPRKDVVTK